MEAFGNLRGHTLLKAIITGDDSVIRLYSNQDGRFARRRGGRWAGESRGKDKAAVPSSSAIFRIRPHARSSPVRGAGSWIMNVLRPHPPDGAVRKAGVRARAGPDRVQAISAASNEERGDGLDSASEILNACPHALVCGQQLNAHSSTVAALLLGSVDRRLVSVGACAHRRPAPVF